jgi:predicted PurR-regulated permease PerM
MNDRKKLAQFILLMFITGLLLYLCWLMFKPFVTILLWSAILVIIFHPLYRKILGKVKSHTLSAIITIAISFLTFIIPVLLVSAAAINELAGFAGRSVDEVQQVISDPMHSRFAYVYNYINGFVNLKELIKPEDIKPCYTGKEIMLSLVVPYRRCFRNVHRYTVLDFCNVLSFP